jgi:hypothetical protein
LDEQRDFFNEKKVEVEAARRLLVPATKQEVGNENQQDNPEEARLDVQNETEERHGNEEKEANSKEARLDVHNETKEEMDDDVSRKDSFYDAKEDDVTVAHPPLSPASVGLLLLIAAIVGLAVTWYTRKLQRKRSGLRKKLDLAAPYLPV